MRRVLIDEKVALLGIKLGHLAAERDRDAYLRQLAELCAQITDAERSTVYLVDRKTGLLRARTAWRVSVDISMPVGIGLAGHTAATGETINVPDAYADPRFNREVDLRTGFRTQNALVVPVWGKAGRDVVGVLQVLNKQAGSFERRDQMFLERVADAAGPVLEQVQAQEMGSR